MNSTATRPIVKARRPARPTHGNCRLTLAINGQSYGVKPLAIDPSIGSKAFRLRKADGTTYEVIRTGHGPECSCPDWIFNRDGKDPNGCKHVKSLIACCVL